MSTPHNALRAFPETERSRAATTFNGTFQTLGGVFAHNPVILILDNQSSVEVAVSFDGVNTWKTFTATEALVLDLRGNHGIAANFSFPIGSQIYVNGVAGTGSFRVSTIYAA